MFKSVLNAKLKAKGQSHAATRHPSHRPPLPPDPRPEPGARPHPAGHEPADHRPPRARVRHAGAQGARRHQADLQDEASGRDLPRFRHRCLGGRARQHAEPGRPRADVRDRPLRIAVAEDGHAARPVDRVPCLVRQGRAAARRAQLAPRRAGRPHRGAPAQGHRKEDQGRVRGAQRNLHRRHFRHRLGAQGHRRGGPPCPADGRQHLGPGERRFPARRMGRGRHHQRLAEGPDAAAGHQLQRARRARSKPRKARSCRAPSGPGTRSWR